MKKNIFANARKKKMKPRRKFQKKGMKTILIPNGNGCLDIVDMTFAQDSVDGTLSKARDLAMYWRMVVPNAEIHIRRGSRVIVKPHNAQDCFKACKFAFRVNGSYKRNV